MTASNTDVKSGEKVCAYRELKLGLANARAYGAHILREFEKGHSRKPTFIHSHTYTVPGRRQAGLFSELPRRVLLGNSEIHRTLKERLGSRVETHTPFTLENLRLLPTP